MNDLVVDYQFNTVTNSSNNVVEIRANVIAKATGATFRNGFGLQLDGIPPSKIYSCSGNIITPNSIYNFLPNGMEAGQTYANCIVFDNFYKVLEHPGSGTGINTSPGAPFVPYDTIPVLIEFIHNGVPASGGTVSINQLGSGTFNFYMVRNLQRGNEIHLADRIPTSLANTSLFGTGIDDSDPSQGKYYKTANNLPWGINIIQGFEYPAEKSAINDAYLHFIDWAVSSGADYPDWYTNHPGYRNPAQIY
jgi:LruC domain-containing protein